MNKNSSEGSKLHRADSSSESKATPELDAAPRKRIYDHGTVWALSTALREVVERFPSQHLLDNSDDDKRTGTRPAPASRYTTIAEVRRWREVLRTYGVE